MLCQRKWTKRVLPVNLSDATLTLVIGTKYLQEGKKRKKDQGMDIVRHAENSVTARIGNHSIVLQEWDIRLWFVEELNIQQNGSCFFDNMNIATIIGRLKLTHLKHFAASSNAIDFHQSLAENFGETDRHLCPAFLTHLCLEGKQNLRQKTKQNNQARKWTSNLFTCEHRWPNCYRKRPHQLHSQLCNNDNHSIEDSARKCQPCKTSPWAQAQGWTMMPPHRRSRQSPEDETEKKGDVEDDNTHTHTHLHSRTCEQTITSPI